MGYKLRLLTVLPGEKNLELLVVSQKLRVRKEKSITKLWSNNYLVQYDPSYAIISRTEC